MFYARLFIADIPVLTTYLEHPSLTVRMNVLNLLCETIAVASHRDRDVEARLRSERYRHLLVVVNNPERRKKVLEAELEKQFSTVHPEVMESIQAWLKQEH